MHGAVLLHDPLLPRGLIEIPATREAECESLTYVSYAHK